MKTRFNSQGSSPSPYPGQVLLEEVADNPLSDERIPEEEDEGSMGQGWDPDNIATRNGSFLDFLDLPGDNEEPSIGIPVNPPKSVAAPAQEQAPPESSAGTLQQAPGQQVPPAGSAGTSRRGQATPPWGRVTGGFNPDYRYTQEDFYGKQPDIYWTDPRGVQMYVPKAGKLPMAIIASISQNLAKQQAEVSAAKQKLINQVKAPKQYKTADPYQASFNQFYFDRVNTYIKERAELYGGEQALFATIASDPNGEEARRWNAMNAEVEALGQQAEATWNRAKDYLKAAKEGKIITDENTLRVAEDTEQAIRSMRGTNSSGDFAKLRDLTENFNQRMSLEEYIKTFVLPKIDEMRSKDPGEVVVTRDGRIMRYEWDSTEQLPQEAMERIAQNYSDFVGADKDKTLQSVKDILGGVLKTRNMQLRAIPQSSSSGGGGGGRTNSSGYILNDGLRDAYSQQSDGKPVATSKYQEYYIDLKQQKSSTNTAGDMLSMRQMSIDGSEQYVIPTRIARRYDGTWWLEGKKAKGSGEISGKKRQPATLQVEGLDGDTGEGEESAGSLSYLPMQDFRVEIPKDSHIWAEFGINDPEKRYEDFMSSRRKSGTRKADTNKTDADPLNIR